MQVSKTRPCLYDMMQLYEDNYRYLMRILPHMKEISGTVFSEYNGKPVLFIDVLEQAPYTSLLEINHYLNTGTSIITDLELRLRVCHDARVAEVISYQQHDRLLPVYHYPNRKMYQRFEKKRINLFLREWLLHCLHYGFQFDKSEA